MVEKCYTMTEISATETVTAYLRFRENLNLTFGVRSDQESHTSNHGLNRTHHKYELNIHTILR